MEALRDLISERDPPPKRGCTTGEPERHLTEGAVIVAFAMHLLEPLRRRARTQAEG